MNTKSLQSRLDELECAVGAIREEIEAAGNDALAACRPVDDDDDLPLPRLEMEWTKSADPDWDWEIEYRLVYCHFLGHTECVRMGLTKSGSGNRRPDFKALLSGDAEGARWVLPFRDGAHITHDSGHLGLPIYVVTPDGTGRISGNPSAVETGASRRREVASNA